MALWVCVNDGVAYSVGAPACPECGSTEHVEQDSPEHQALLVARGEVDPGDAVPTGARPGDDAADDDVPDGTVDDVMAWVGDDRARALRALTKEQAAKSPRRSLMDQLAKVIDEAGSNEASR
jgi:hypothetical protein